MKMRKCEKQSVQPILPEDFFESPCMLLGDKKINFICTRCRVACDTSLCEDIDEVNYHQMATHKIFTEENSIKNGVTCRTFNYLFGLDTSNLKIRKCLNLSSKKRAYSGLR